MRNKNKLQLSFRLRNGVYITLQSPAGLQGLPNCDSKRFRLESQLAKCLALRFECQRPNCILDKNFESIKLPRTLNFKCKWE